MDGATGDSDHSMTWEDFFGSTTDLTPTLIGIYDSLLEPEKSLRPETGRLETAKDARNDPPVKPTRVRKEITISKIEEAPTMMTGGVELPIANYNKSSLYAIRTKSDKDSVSDDVNKFNVSDASINKIQRTLKETKQVADTTFGNLSPNVKRMISSSEMTTLKFQKKTINIGRTSMRKSNIPLVGATSKISQSGVEILPSVEIYDQPCVAKNLNKSKGEENESPKSVPLKPEFKIDDAQTYDVPTNNRPAIYDVPVNNKTAFESLSLPYIDQSIELSITSNDREFDIKLSSKETSPVQQKASVESPVKIPTEGTNSLHRKDFVNKSESPSKLFSKAAPYSETIGSTGNLKTEKEVIRLNPPVVEVSRPLSMSSIASSSSTSSSGVQNKGGVNSAYLASIESLDDHSDVDMTSANGSNNFVNNAGIMTASVSEERNSVDTTPQLIDEMPGLSQLERVCSEIIQTENVYVEDLRQVVEGYLHVWRREMTFSEEQLSELFNNIEDIYTFNRSLCAELNTCRLDAISIARCFVNNTSGFSVYTSYCTGYPRTMERLAALASEPHSAREFRERQIALGHLLPLASYLLKPVQRILKYHLLLQNVVKQCASRETEYALLKMTGIAQHIDDMKRRHEHAVRVQEIQSLLYGWNGPDLTTYGELCAEGTFRVFGAKAMRHAFLFDKMMLVTKNREDGILAYKSHIMCNNMMLVESIAGAPLSFHVIPWDAPRAQLTLQARSPRHKREWTLLLKRVILENYNAVIPSHARQLVMELGQNKTDDDILAEKSHNLITQASMRKQLSAPEYLEKRKLDRDRRKSFESGIRGRLKKANRKYTVPSSRAESQECDCSQVSAEKGTDYTCENCYVDLCSDCETEVGKEKSEEKCCRHDDRELGEKCPECDRSLHYIDAGSAEHLERKQLGCKCSDFKSSQESFGKEFGCPLNKTRGYHSSDNIIGYADKSKEDLSDNNSLTSIRHINRTCLKCAKIKENIVVTDISSTLHTRRSRCNDSEKQKADNIRSKSKDDPQRSRLSKIGTWRRKSEPGLQQNMIGIITKKSQDNDSERPEIRGNEKIEFECKNCGSNKVSRKTRANDGTVFSDLEQDSKRNVGAAKPAVEIRMYNTKNIPKKISKIKKNRAKGLRLGTDTTAKFYADFSTDVSTENILHISESNDSLNIDKPKEIQNPVPDTISKDEDIDEETYKKLIEKTDSFKKNELEKVKYLNKQKVINETCETEDKICETEIKPGEVIESCEETEQPLEQIISQLLMQNREFQKLVKKQQQRNSAQRRHQRLMKSHSSPEQTILAKSLESNKIKAKYGRQTSEDLDIDKNYEEDNTTTSSITDVTEEVIEDHIYETLRIDNRVDENLHSLDRKSKMIQHVNRPKRLSSPPNTASNDSEIDTCIGPDSDYVYLSFNKPNEQQDIEGIYDVPVRSPKKIHNRNSADYYVTMEHKGPGINEIINENVYDTLEEVCRRKKEVPSELLPGDYLPMSPDQQSPNTPEIWLSRQKEHFNVSRDRKSGSLPRSFQVITSNPEENLSTFKCKPNSNSKTYLNRDGKVMSTDRPFTIASDQSEINYDDMSEGEMLKFNKPKTNDVDYVENISQSTLELEEEIDRCYKNNFEKIDLDNNKNSNLTVSQPNLTISTTSSCEVLPLDRNEDTKPNDIEIIHPEHKIYKPTSNMLSLKNVLSRFKYRSPSKNSDEIEINANDQSSPESIKSDLKSPEKRSALNPRSYSKNLLQRFRSIIGDEHTDNNLNKSETTNLVSSSEDVQNNLMKSEIKVVITSTDSGPTNSTAVYSTNNDLLSKSVCENTTLSESQTEKNNLEALSLSCDNINKKSDINSPCYDKSISMVNNIPTSISSPAKSNNSSYQSLNKLPIYMQGSKHLGARIAQSDYVDPTTLAYEKSTTLKKVNILINKNSVRPDSLFSNSSFVTSSSEGAYQEPLNKLNTNPNLPEDKLVNSNLQDNSDESYYEKSFEKIEQVTDEDVFRDSAVYSDQEDSEDTKDTATKDRVINKNITRVESIQSKTTVHSQHNINEKITTQTRVIVTSNKTANVERVNGSKKSVNISPKVAPPVPAKPKITRIPSVSNNQNKSVSRTLSRSSEQSSSSESVNMKTIKRNVNYKQSLVKSDSSNINEKTKTTHYENSIKSDFTISTETITVHGGGDKSKPQGNIQMKRLSFERASLDSATRKQKPLVEEQNTILEKPQSSKSVLERRMAIEQMSKIQSKLNQTIKKPTQSTKPKSITTKVATFERSVSDIGVKEKARIPSTDKNIPNRNSIEQKSDNEGEKSSWVKQVVNKFQ